MRRTPMPDATALRHPITLAFLVAALVAAVSVERAPAQSATVRSGSSQSIQEAQQESALGPKARVAVAQFRDKTGKGWWTGQIGDGMADMLATALFNSSRFIVLERQQLNSVLREQDLAAAGRVKKETAAPIGEIEGAELLVTGAVTEFDPGASGMKAGVGGFGLPSWATGALGAVSGGFKQAHMAIDMRVIDTKTSRVVAATSVEGKATDFNIGAAVAGYGGGVALGSALGGW